jgi:hypothetical protein
MLLLLQGLPVVTGEAKNLTVSNGVVFAPHRPRDYMVCLYLKLREQLSAILTRVKRNS